MKKLRLLSVTLLMILGLSAHAQQQAPADYPANYAKAPRFKALLYYDPKAEVAHVQFDEQALHFFKKLTFGEGYILDVTTDLSEYADRLSDYSILISCNYCILDEPVRQAFQQYMEQGGGWIGFHSSAFCYPGGEYHWPWLNEFLGCGEFLCNQWPPQPALVDVETEEHPVTRTLPKQFVAPASEFYQWRTSPRLDKDVDILISISPKMYPFGIKDVVKFGDFPVVWTNKRYRMIYLNMGHGDECFIEATQNLLFTNAFRWIVSRDPKGDPFEK